MRGEWLKAYEDAGIEMTFAATEDKYWWDEEVYDWLKKYGASKFRRCVIWYKDWNRINVSPEGADAEAIHDPRSTMDKAIQYYLRITQGIHQTFFIRAIDRLLQIIW